MEAINAGFRDNRPDSAAEYFGDGDAVAHVQQLPMSGAEGGAYLPRLLASLGPDATKQELASRYLEDERASVTLWFVQGGTEERPVKNLLLAAFRYDEDGRVVEEEYLPVASTADAQAYFPDTPLPAKRVKPKLSFIAATRKRKSRLGRKLGIRLKDTDLHRIPKVGKTVLANFREAGVNTFQDLSTASDDLLASVRDASGRALRNFDFSYWRSVGEKFVAGELDAFPAPPKVRKAKTGKRSQDIDYQTLQPGDIDYLPRVGAKLLGAMHAAGIYTFEDLAGASDETLESLREPAGRPFVNFDMTYFRKAAQAVVNGKSAVPDYPKPEKAKKGSGRPHPSKLRNVNPNDLHVLPGVGKQLIAALHEENVFTFADLAEAPDDVLRGARAKIKGKYKNFDLNYLRRQANFARNGEFEKFEYPVKIERAPKKKSAKSTAANFLDKLQRASEEDIDIFDGIGKVVKEALASKGIRTIPQLAEASQETLKEALATAGPRFAGFRVEYWVDAAKKFLAGEFDAIAPKAPKKTKPKAKSSRKVRVRKPVDEKDLKALPNVGSTVAFELKAAGLDTFSKIAAASDAQLTSVRTNCGPRYKNFDVSYWRTVAAMAAEGNYDYPGTIAKEDVPRKARKQKPTDPTKLKRLASVGQALADSLRDNGIQTWTDIVDAPDWKLMKAIDEAGKRKLSIKPQELVQSAKDALNGKFPERKKREKKAGLPEGYDDFTRLPGVSLGKAAMTRLHEAGIKSYRDLGKATIASLEAIRDTMRGRVATADVRKWRELAKLAAKGAWDEIDGGQPGPEPKKRPAAPKDGDDLSAIKGIRHKDQQLLRSRGVKSFADLVGLDNDTLADYLEENGGKAKKSAIASIKDQAEALANGADPKDVRKAARAKKG